MHEASCIIRYSCVFTHSRWVLHRCIRLFWLIGSGNTHARALGDLAVASQFLSIKDSIRG
jgi:hypothetical protein